MTKEKPPGYVFGRPRSHDRKQVGLDFIEYVKTHPDCYTVPQFATHINLSSDVFLDWCEEDEDFSRSYNIAKELIGINRLKAATTKDHNGNAIMDKALYLKGEGNYNRDIRSYQRGEMAYEYGLKKENDAAQSKQMVLQVNYPNDNNNPVKVLPEAIPTTDPEGSK